MPDIARLGPEDVDAYRALFLRGLDLFPDAFLLTRGEAEAWPVEATRERLAAGWMFGARDGGALTGVIGGRRLTPGRRAHRMEVGPMLVMPEAQGTGTAAALVDALTAEARAVDVLQLELEVASDNSRAIAFYRKVGFEETGRIVRSVRTESGGFLDDLSMMRRLG
ncbi:GNAT family N-acetyltransferase [Wenxinia marina]|uniref:Acetyltransferase n=1 Tax=Wenxinia marina DSM 24838 TaxID=1123501 RepID=A0A0D0QGE3_9RHOB|nr:GNAT family N-acetyltransferase [Wenxinia marina]KIQ70088.1 Acetyltransferase [Wenxinia marina DSM 24838]GGL63400.1 N-acetyltransferase [Wenxinia marina]